MGSCVFPVRWFCLQSFELITLAKPLPNPYAAALYKIKSQNVKIISPSVIEYEYGQPLNFGTRFLLFKIYLTLVISQIDLNSSTKQNFINRPH